MRCGGHVQKSAKTDPGVLYALVKKTLASFFWSFFKIYCTSPIDMRCGCHVQESAKTDPGVLYALVKKNASELIFDVQHAFFQNLLYVTN